MVAEPRHSASGDFRSQGGSGPVDPDPRPKSEEFLHHRAASFALKLPAVDKRVDELVAAVGQVGDARLLVMASLLVADELSEVYTELDALRNERRGPTVAAAAMAIGDLDRLASRIEGIADRLERA